MSLYQDSYETSVGGMLVSKPIRTAILEMSIRVMPNSLDVKYEGDVKPLFVTGTRMEEDHVPLFTHPITVFNANHGNWLATDLRLFVRKDAPIDNLEASVKNLTEFNFAKSRGILNLIWVNGGVGRIKNSLQFASSVYSAWLSEIISKTYALDFGDKTTVSVIASFFYQTLFLDKDEYDEEDRMKMASHTITATKVPSERVLQIFDKIGKMSTIDDLCRYIVDITQNVRLKGFNVPMLLTLVKNSWYGTNAKEIISVSLEHPPTWAAIVYSALSERSYKNSTVYRIAEPLGKRGGSDEFLKNYVGMVKETKDVSMEAQQILIRDFE
jgi:hypothetical protein